MQSSPKGVQVNSGGEAHVCGGQFEVAIQMQMMNMETEGLSAGHGESGGRGLKTPDE